jgi:hypothetical protein
VRLTLKRAKYLNKSWVCKELSIKDVRSGKEKVWRRSALKIQINHLGTSPKLTILTYKFIISSPIFNRAKYLLNSLVPQRLLNNWYTLSSISNLNAKEKWAKGCWDVKIKKTNRRIPPLSESGIQKIFITIIGAGLGAYLW